MRQILAIAVLTTRAVTRSRIFLSLALAVLAVVTLLPMTIESDGTVEGQVQVSLQYSLKAVLFLLAAATVWTACLVSSQDITGRQLHLVLTKPVHRTQVWLGKWLGMLAVNLALLALAGIGSYFSLDFSLRSAGFNTEESRRALSEEVLVARTTVAPEPGAGDGPVPPGQSRQWLFRLKHAPDSGAPVFVLYNLSSPRQLDLKPVSVLWRAGGQPVVEGEIFAGRPRSFRVPASAVSTDGLLTLEYVNRQTDPPDSTSFDYAKPVAVLYRTGSFEANLLRALLVMFCQLAVIAALGITAGSLFHMPTATFVAVAALTVFLLGGFISMAAVDPDVRIYRPIPSTSSLDGIIRTHFRFFNSVLGPVRQFDVLAALPRGETVPWSTVGRAFAIMALGYSGVIALVGIWFFNRRELGLPSE